MEKKIKGNYGSVMTNWIDIDSLISIKKDIDEPRHQDDVRILIKVKEMNGIS